MKSLAGPIWDLWNSGGPFLGRDKPSGVVTVEFGWLLRASTGPVGDWPAEKLPLRWYQRADSSQVETELPNVKSVNITRSIDQDAATCDIDVYNTQMLPQALAELGNPGYFTFGRGSHPDATTRWGHVANEWSTELGPNALVRTYEGYGGYHDDGSRMTTAEAIAAGYLTQTGVWLIDEARPETQDNMLHIKLRDAGKLAIDQPLLPPLVPEGIYPLQYARFFYRHISTPYIAYGAAAGGVKIIVGMVADAGNDGYWLVGDDGGVFTYGDNYFHGSLAGDVDHEVVGMARSFGKEGYWLATKDGTVFRFGDASNHGFGASPATGDEMVAIESLETIDGYYLADNTGHVYSLGSAVYHGGGASTPAVVAMAAMPDGSGYWLLDESGEVFSFGAAAYYGNGDPGVGSPYTAIECTPSGLGYWLTTKRGHVYAMGDAPYFGGTSAITLNDPISDIVRRPDGAGYWLVAEDGGVFTFGPINFYGSLPGATENDYPYDGNYFDYSDIVKDLLLWCGFWLYDGGIRPDVFGNIESTGIYDPLGFLPIDMFDKKAPMEAINAIKEIVGYITWVDSEGGFHFESPNWWSEGNFMPDGSRTNVLPQVDEKIQLVSYGVSADDKSARDRVIITNIDPVVGSFPHVEGIPDAVTTTVVPLTAPALRGLLKPAMWSNYVFSSEADQLVMAKLLGNQLVFLQRVGSVVCWANPMLELNDQVRIWERQTDEVYDHYIRGISTSHDFDTGEYTMTLTTHWLGRDWAGPGPRRNVLAGSIRSAEVCGHPVVEGGGAVANMSGLNVSTQFGNPLVSAPQSVAIGGVSSAEAFGLPIVGALPTTVTMAGAASASAIGRPTVIGTQAIAPAGASTSGALGAPTVTVPAGARVTYAGIGTRAIGAFPLGSG